MRTLLQYLSQPAKTLSVLRGCEPYLAPEKASEKARVFIAHLVRPDLQIDAISIGLLIVCVLPWASSFVETLKAPGGWEVKLAKLDARVEQVIDASSEAAADPIGPTDPQSTHLTDHQLSVLDALTKASVPLRSVEGIRKETALDTTEVQSSLDALFKNGRLNSRIQVT